MATIVAAAGGGNWTVGATWVGGIAPTAADDAQLVLASGAVTIDVGAVARSLDATTYTGVLTHNAAATLTLGDATAGAGSKALTLVAGMTYTLNDPATSAISFISTSATVQDVDFGTKTHGNLDFFAASNGSWRLVGASTTASTATVVLTKGTLDTNGQTISWGAFSSNFANVRTLTLGASAVTITGTGTSWNALVTNFTLNTNTSIINLTGAAATFSGSTLTYNNVRLTGSGAMTIQGSSTFGTFERTGTAVKTDSLSVAANFTVTGTLIFAGNSSINRIFVRSSVMGTQRTITNAGATMTWSNVTLQDIALGTAFNASAITGLSGDAGGNSNITFTTAAPQFWIGDTGTWSDSTQWSLSSGGAANGRVPLPQDDTNFDNGSFSGAGQSVTMDMPRVGRSMDWSSYSEGQTPTLIHNTTSVFYGSVTLIAGMTFNSASSSTVFEGRGAFTLTSAGKVLSVFTLQAVGGTLTLQDSVSVVNNFNVFNGTFNANNFNVTALGIVISGSATRTVTMGSGTWTATGTGTSSWNAATTAGLTFNAGTSTILFSNTSAVSKTFQGGGLTYNFFNITGGGTGAVIITGSNTFANLPQISGGTKTLQYTAGTTTTYTGGIGFGNGTNIITISSVTAAVHNLSMASGIVSADYLNLTNSNATGGATWYAGANSVDNGGNTGWIFTAAPGGGPGSSGMLLLMGVGT